MTLALAPDPAAGPHPPAGAAPDAWRRAPAPLPDPLPAAPATDHVAGVAVRSSGAHPAAAAPASQSPQTSSRGLLVAGVRFDDRPLARLALLGVLSAVAAALQVIEAPLPRLLPWVKPGLANAIVLFAIVRLSPAFAVGLVLIRSLLSGLALGMLFSPAHLLGVAGGLAAAAVMTLAVGAGRGQLGLAGISVLGAVAHNLAQLGTIGLWAGHGFPLWFHLTIMVWLSIPSGLLVAALTFELFRRTA